MRSIVLVAAGAALLMGGCASMKPTETYSWSDDVDVQKVAAINNVARARGVSVHWMNYPQKKAAATVVPSLGEPTGT